MFVLASTSNVFVSFGHLMMMLFSSLCMGALVFSFIPQTFSTWKSENASREAIRTEMLGISIFAILFVAGIAIGMYALLFWGAGICLYIFAEYQDIYQKADAKAKNDHDGIDIHNPDA